MKLSKVAQIYDQIERASGEASRVELLAGLFRRADEKMLEAAARFTVGEVVEPYLSDRLGIGPGMIRAALAQLSGKRVDDIDKAVRKTGDMSEVVARFVNGSDSLTVSELWERVNRAVKRDEDRLSLVKHVFTHTTSNGSKYFVRMVLNQMRIGVGFGTRTSSRIYAAM